MRIACLSDAHGNYLALQKALSLIETDNLEKIVFLGDAIGYFPSLKVLDILNDRDDIICIRGNHDDIMLSKSLSPSLEHIYYHQVALDCATTNHERQVNKWHDYFIEKNAIFFHGGPANYQNQYIYPDTDLHDIYNSIKEMDDTINICVSGHTHRPFIRKFKDMVFVNTGSVGLPRDFGTYGSFAIIDTHNIAADIYRFNIEGCLKQMIRLYPHTHPSVIELMSRNNEPIPQGIILS